MEAVKRRATYLYLVTITSVHNVESRMKYEWPMVMMWPDLGAGDKGSGLEG